MPFDALLRAAAAPVDASSSELRFPLVKLGSPANVESDIVNNRRRSRACGNPVLITIRPHIRELSVRRGSDRKPQHIACKVREFFPVRHTDADLHNFLDCRHGRNSFFKDHLWLNMPFVDPTISLEP